MKADGEEISGKEAESETAGGKEENGNMAIEVISVRNAGMAEKHSTQTERDTAGNGCQQTTQLSAESREEKARRLQWLLQQLIRETLRENNEELCRNMKESIIKELDYQFRSQEEREEERDRLAQQRSEEYYKRMDELLRKKSGRRMEKQERKEQAAEKATAQKPAAGKKKRHFVF